VSDSEINVSQPAVPAQEYLDKKSVFVISQILFVVVMLHSCFRSDFYEIDDKTFIAPITKNNWTEFLWTYSVPVVVVSFRLDYLVFNQFIAQEPPLTDEQKSRLDSRRYISSALAPPMRVMNALYHIAGGFLLWLFLRRLNVGAGIAFLVALLWTGHPMNCENVCWIIERKTVLCAMFGFGALLVWTYDAWWRLPLFNLLFALSFLSKASALGLLPLIVLLHILVPGNGQPFSLRSVRWGKLILDSAGPVLISAAFMVPNVKVFSPEFVAPPGGSAWTALLTDVEIFSRYVHHTLVPFRLTFYNSVLPIVSLGDLRLWLYGLALVIVIAGLLYFTEREKRPLALLGCLWFFAALGPHSNIISIPYWMQDRYAALGIPGLLLAVFLAAKGLAQRYQNIGNWIPRASIAYVLIFLSLLAYRASFYKNSDVLELDAVRYQPLSAFAKLRAARILHNEMNRNAPGSPTPDLQRFVMAAKGTAFHLEGALLCPDLTNFRDIFDTRLAAVEILGQLGLHAEVKKALQGWLPPADLQMLEVSDMQESQKMAVSRKHVSRGYLPQTLARAWALCAESSFQMSLDSRLNPTQRRELLSLSVKEADSSLAVPPNDESARLVKFRSLVEISKLDRIENHTEAADKNMSTAIEVLKQMPQSSKWYPEAQRLLTAMTPKNSSTGPESR
jgi:hypothetical protein